MSLLYQRVPIMYRGVFRDYINSLLSEVCYFNFICCYFAGKYKRIPQEYVKNELKILLTKDQIVVECGLLKEGNMTKLLDFIGLNECSSSEKHVPIATQYVLLIARAAAHQRDCERLANYRCIEIFQVNKTVLSLEFIYLVNLYFYAQQKDKPACCCDAFREVPTEKELMAELGQCFEKKALAHELTLVSGGTGSDLLQFIALMEMMPSEKPL